MADSARREDSGRPRRSQTAGYLPLRPVFLPRWETPPDDVGSCGAVSGGLQQKGREVSVRLRRGRVRRAGVLESVGWPLGQRFVCFLFGVLCQVVPPHKRPGADTQ